MAYFAFGNVAIDDLVFADGTTMWDVPGGGAVYAALGMSLWSAAAAVVAPVGPEYPRERFARVDFTGCRVLPHTMRNWGLYETDGSRHFLSRRDSLPWAAFSSDPNELGAGPYPFCHIAPLPWSRAAALVDALRQRGAQAVSLDLHDRELACMAIADVAALIDRVQIFLPSRQDVDVLFPGLPALEALRALRRHLPRVPVIGIKCGPDGSFVHAAGCDTVVAAPSVAAEVIDATGAGDAFCGGFLAGFAQFNDVAEAALRATVSASFALASVGPTALAAVSADAASARLADARRRMTRVPFRV